jgi:hypothetical protein
MDGNAFFSGKALASATETKAVREKVSEGLR